MLLILLYMTNWVINNLAKDVLCHQSRYERRGSPIRFPVHMCLINLHQKCIKMNLVLANLSKSSGVGSSVARAREARVSMIRFTHSIWTAFRGLSWMAQDPMKATTTATTLTVSWNCRNLAMESYTLRPHMTAFTMLVKLSSVRMMSEASLATSVPAMPIAKPTSAWSH